MIIGHSNNILNVLNDSEYKFYLTGSYFFNGSGNDIDLMAAWSFDICDFLVKNKFEKVWTQGYADPSINEVYRHRSGIDVQLIKEGKLGAKLKVQDTLKRWCVDLSNKENARRIWGAMLEVVE